MSLRAATNIYLFLFKVQKRFIVSIPHLVVRWVDKDGIHDEAVPVA